MGKLMRYEIEKLRIGKYVASGIGLILLLCFFMMVAMDSAKQGLAEPVMTYSSIIKAIVTFMIDGCVIYGSVLIANSIVAEYTNKTIFIMFSYPVKKNNIIWAKLLLANVIITLGMIIGSCICFFAVTIIDNYFDMLVGSFRIYDFLYAVIYVIMGIIMANIFMLLPYSIGIWKKSIALTVVSSLVSAFIIQVIMSQSTSIYHIIISVIIAGGFIIAFAKYISNRYIKNIESL